MSRSPRANPVAVARLAPIARIDLYRQVLERLESYIVSANLQPGDRLPGDRELAAQLGVSRPLVRQAIKVLEGLGRVTVQQGAGTFVHDHSYRVLARELLRGIPADRVLLQQLEPLRAAVELMVMRSAFERRTAESLAVLEQALVNREAELARDGEQTTLNLGFEAAMGSICGNEPARRVQLLLHEMWLRTQVEVGLAPADALRLHEEHVEIFDAFRSGDLKRTSDLMSRHLNFTRPSGILARLDRMADERQPAGRRVRPGATRGLRAR
jgi:GntR family transcriptional repressor for pyruvate dehydrogenase complex